MPRCYIIIPRDHSALISFAVTSPAALGRLVTESDCAARNTRNDGTGNYRDRCHDTRTLADLLILQCHSEGVLWRRLLPLLSMRSCTSSALQSTEEPSKQCATTSERPGIGNGYYQCSSKKRRKSVIASRALSILMNHFQNRIHQIEITADETNSDDYEGDCLRRKTDSFNSHHFTASTSKNFFIIQSDDTTNRRFRNNHQSIPTVLLLLPPNNPYQQQQRHQNNYYSRTPSTRPTNSFTLRLIHFENTFIRLTTLSAYISTLGGGFFLCRYLSTAVSLARRQRVIAKMRGDTEMALKCRINEGYCYIHSGKLNRGKKVIRRVLKDVIETQVVREQVGLLDGSEDGLLHHTPERELSELTVIKNMCYSALRFADLIREASAATGDVDVEESVQSSDGRRQFKSSSGSIIEVSTTHDDFQRIRIVQDRTWR